MPANTTYLITGANRGIGKHLLITYLSRPGTTVIAGVRDPTGPSSKSLRDLPKGDGSDVIVVKIDSASEKDAAIAVAEMQSSHNIMKVDVVIANAGISKDYQPVVSATVMQVQEHVSVNAIGPFVLFQSVYRLLQKSANPKFVVVSSAAGSIGGMESRPFPMFAYGASKAMANYLVRKIHCEHEDITSFAVDPGFVQTDMGNAGAQFFGMKEATTTVQDSVKYLVAEIDAATKEGTSGHFRTIEGGDFAW